MMIRLRKNRIFPRQVSDIGAFVFVTFMMPATYIYETTIVIPSVYAESFMYYIHMAAGFFILCNLVGNFLGLWLVDTSTRFVVLPSVIKVIYIHVNQSSCEIQQIFY